MKKSTYNIPPFSCLALADGQKFLLRPPDPQTRKLFKKKTDSLIITKNPVGLGVHFIRYYFLPVMRPLSIQFSTRHYRNFIHYIGSHIVGDYNTIRKACMIRSPFSFFLDKSSLPVVDHPLSIYKIPGRTR
jgi:hypothetical protein